LRRDQPRALIRPDVDPDDLSWEEGRHFKLVRASGRTSQPPGFGLVVPTRVCCH
jgi:hypothetical protein